MYTRLFYMPEQTGGGLPPSLNDLDNETSQIQGGADPNKVPDLTQVQQQQQQQQQQTQESEGGQQQPPQEGVNEDGTLKEGYEYNEKGEVVKKESDNKGDGNGEGDDDDPPGSPSSGGESDDEDFFAEVDKLRGEKLEIEYPEGVDPQSPEGVYHREKFIEKRAVENFEEYLKKADPRGYAYLLHRQAGGSDEDFYKTKSFSLPEYEEFKQNADLQLRVYKSDLTAKGLDPESVQVLVEKAVKENKLFELADQSYRNTEATQRRELEEIDQRNKRAQEQYNRSVQTLDQTLVTSVNEGKNLNLIIPDTDKKNFLNFLREQIEYDKDSQQFLFVQPVSKEELGRQIESLYLLYKKGDLKSLIQREAQVQNRKRLEKRIAKSKTGQLPGSESQKMNQDIVPLGSL